MGLMWRLLAPRPLKKARRAMHPSWIIEDAIVHSVRGNKRRRRTRATRGFQGVGVAYTPDKRHVRFVCGHQHRSQAAMVECMAKRQKQIERGTNLHLVTRVLDTPESRQRDTERTELKAKRQQARQETRQGLVGTVGLPSYWQQQSPGSKAFILTLPVLTIAIVIIGSVTSHSPATAVSSSYATRHTSTPPTLLPTPTPTPTLLPTSTPTPTPTRRHRRHRHHHVIVVPVPPPTTQAPPPASCYPTTSSGNCYEPGEFCPEADAGTTGIAGDGDSITCTLVSERYHWESGAT